MTYETKKFLPDPVPTGQLPLEVLADRGWFLEFLKSGQRH